MDAKKIKEKIKIAYKSIEGLEEPLKTKTYEIILNRLLAEEELKEIEKNKDDVLRDQASEQLQTEKNSQVPSIEGKNLTEQIKNLLASDWGKVPRTLNEIKNALAINAFHYPVTTISPRLTALTKKGILRRLQRGKTFSYVLAKR